MDQGLKKIAIIHVNNDFGVNMVAEFKRAYEVLGGQITSLTPHNQGQASYAPEVTRGLEGDPPALYLVSYPATAQQSHALGSRRMAPQSFS